MGIWARIKGFFFPKTSDFKAKPRTKEEKKAKQQEKIQISKAPRKRHGRTFARKTGPEKSYYTHTFVFICLIFIDYDTLEPLQVVEEHQHFFSYCDNSPQFSIRKAMELHYALYTYHYIDNVEHYATYKPKSD